jgi:hypothetical protein
MREAGFEPAHPEIVGLKSTALDHSAIRANICFFILFIYAGPTFSPPISYTGNVFKWFLYIYYTKPRNRVEVENPEIYCHPTRDNNATVDAAASESSGSNNFARHIGQFNDISHHFRKQRTQNK